MKHILQFGLALLTLIAPAQELKHCATDVVMRKFYAQHPDALQRKKLAEQINAARPARPSSTSYVIPIVFHILHLNGAENISDAQVKDAVRILNRDYAKQNPDTVQIIPAFKNIADSAGIRFVLATRDPMGNCTNGIVHHYDADTDWNDQSNTIYSYTWDPTRYLNVYIVRTITLSSGFGAAGYTWYPGTWLSGDPYDAVVVLNNYLGSIGTSSDFTSRVLTHEVGHWFNLAHVFGAMQGAGIDCSDDDFVADTPPTAGYTNCPNPAVPAQYQNCTPGISENFQNYMDYSYCCRMFTQGQAQRMQAALQDNTVGRDNLWTNANLLSTGVVSPTVPCLPVADFKFNRAKTCIGTPITFSDASWNAPVTSYSWTFPGGTPASSTFSAPLVTYASPGLYSVYYTSYNSAGASAPVIKGNIITVTGNTALYTGAWAEGFENLPQFSADWVFGSSNGSANWVQSGDAYYSGSFSAKLGKNYNTRRAVTYMISPSVNLSALTNPALSFKLAAAEVTSNHINALKVYASTDCGTTWTVIYSRSGQALVTTSSQNSDFIPAGHSEWRQETISLQQIATAAYATFKYEYTRDTIPAANNIYLDDINIGSATAIQEYQAAALYNLEVFPVPAKNEVTVSFSIFSDQKISFGLRDILGRTVEAPEEIVFEAGQQAHRLDISRQPAGVYFLSITIQGRQYTHKLVIAN